MGVLELHSAIGFEVSGGELVSQQLLLTCALTELLFEERRETETRTLEILPHLQRHFILHSSCSPRWLKNLSRSAVTHLRISGLLL